MRIGRVFGAVATSWFFGLGGGLASLGYWEYSLAWVVVVPLTALLATFVTPWLLLLLPIALVGSIAHTIAIAQRTAKPFRVLHWMPWASVAFTLFTGAATRTFVVEAFKTPASSMYPTLHIGDHILVDRVTRHWRSWQRGDLIVHVYPCDTARDYIKRIVGLPGDSIEVRCNVVYVNGHAVPSTPVPGPCGYQDYDESSDQWHDRRCSRYHESLDGHDWDVFDNEDRPEHAARWKQGQLATGDDRDFPVRFHMFPPSCSDAYSADSHDERPQGKIVETKPAETAGVCEPQVHYVVPDDQVFVLGDNRSNSNDSRIWGGVPIDYIKGRVRSIWWSSHESGRIGPVH